MAIPQPSKLPTPVRFWPMLCISMLKKIPYFLPMFSWIIFKFQNISLSFFNFKNKQKFLIPVSFTYDNLNFANLKQFNKFILKTISVHWVRVAFRGKGYRLRKFKKVNKLTLNFGHSHWAKLILRRGIFFFKKIRRQNYICLIQGYEYFRSFKNGIKFFKKLNRYTKRGLRLRKQYIQKRFGKISQVVSSLH